MTERGAHVPGADWQPDPAHEPRAPTPAREGDAPGARPAPGPGGIMTGSRAGLAAAALAGSLLAFGEKLPCRDGGWNVPGKQFQLACYTDIYPLYFTEHLADGKVPYTGHPVEYPVLIGAVMQAAAWLVRSIANPFMRGQRFFDVTVAGLTVFFVVGVLATAYAAGHPRRRDALLVALSP